MRAGRNKQSLYFFIFSLILKISFACKLVTEDDVSFIVSEVPENYEKGKLLPDCLRIERGHGESVALVRDMEDESDNSAWKYVSAHINTETSCVEFYLLGDLSEYRRERWRPDVDSQFTLCCSNQNLTFNHLLLIKDENLYEPTFSFKNYHGIISHSFFQGFRLEINAANDEDENKEEYGGGNGLLRSYGYGYGDGYHNQTPTTTDNYFINRSTSTRHVPVTTDDYITSEYPSATTENGFETSTVSIPVTEENYMTAPPIEPSSTTEIDEEIINEIKIFIRDADFNSKNANVDTECVGVDCNYFNFKLIPMEEDHGYNFEVSVELNSHASLHEDFSNGKIIQFELIANDGVKTSSANFIFVVEMMSEEAPSQPGGNDSGSNLYVPIGIAAGMGLILLLGTSGSLAFYVWKSRQSKDIVKKLTEAEIREFLEGTANISAEVGRSVDINTPIMALPYNRAFEIARENLRIDETTILGTGAFGVVWKGSVVYSNGDDKTVAVKSIKRNVGVLYFRALLSELKIMAYIGKHPNIVSLVGACTHNIRKREVYIAVQYCSNGNFHNYLKARRDRFTNLVTDGKLELTNAAMQSYMYSNQGIFSKSFSTLDLLRWAIQIASGLQYLESLGVIHGDLALRNILMDSERTAKIGDFGLSRRLIDYSNLYYTKTTQAPLPWKWMAPESLRDMKFSKKSDIWSFGIVLWEIFTLASTPYPGLNWDETFVERLESGMRPKKPQFATLKLYDMMLDCWDLEPHDRPAILDLKRELEDVTNTALRQKQDASYMRFWGEQPILTLIAEDQEGYLLPNDPHRVDYVDT